MPLLVAALEMTGPRSTISSWLGLVAGTWGIIYGIKAKGFTAYGHDALESHPLRRRKRSSETYTRPCSEGAAEILLSKRVPEHRQAAFRLLLRGFVLDHIPVLDQNPVLDTKNVRCNPIHRSTETAKSAVHDHEISVGHDRSRFVLERWRKALDEIEQAITARRDMSAVLDVVGRPKLLGGRIVAFVE